jgi:hypothetical protein
MDSKGKWPFPGLPLSVKAPSPGSPGEVGGLQGDVASGWVINQVISQGRDRAGTIEGTGASRRISGEERVQQDHRAALVHNASDGQGR